MGVVWELGKPSSNRSNSRRATKLKDRDRRALNRIVGRKHRTTTIKVTAGLNQHLNSSVSIRTVRRALNKAGYHTGAAIREPPLSSINIQKRLKWCRDHKGWSADQWKQVIFFDESSISPFPSAGRVYPDCLLPTVKHGGRSVKV